MVTAVVCSGAQVGAFSCGLLQRQRIGHAAGFRLPPVPMPLLYSGREWQGGLALPLLPDLQPFRKGRAASLRAGAESEHLGVLNVPQQSAEHSESAPQVNSLPQSAPPTPGSATSPENHTTPSSSNHQQPQDEATQQQNAERIANGAHAGPSGQDQHAQTLSDEPPESSGSNQSSSVKQSSPSGSNQMPSDSVRPEQEVPDEPLDGDEGGEPMYGSRTLRDVCDKLIAVFTVEKPEVADWKRLLALSSEWASIRPKFYTHVKRRAKEAEDDGNPEYALQLYSLQRRLNKVEDEMAAHDKLLAEVEAETDWNSMVVRRREEFTQDFFQHIRIRADSQFNELGRRDELVNLSAKLVTAIQVHDNIQKDEALMLKAEEKFLGLLDSPDLSTLDSKIDQLAQTGGLDPALLLTMSKAYCAAKDTNLVRDEVKDIMAHMYFKAQQSQQMYLPKEVRILRYLITIDDPQERYRALEQAFEPGDESDPFEDAENAMLYTTPEALYEVVSSVLKAYFTGAKASTMLKEAAALMRPKVIDRIKLLKDMIQKDFL